jgi:hypothetical protein
MTHKKRSPGITRICLLFAIALTLTVPACAQWNEKVPYSFQGIPDGAVPAGAFNDYLDWGIHNSNGRIDKCQCITHHSLRWE